MSSQDQILRFMFDETDIRGDVVTLSESYQTAVMSHNYPLGVSKLLGEFVAAAVLLSTTIKFAGSIILQAKSDGQIPTIMAECTNDLRIRAIARDAEYATSEDFRELLAGGTLAITIDPVKGKRYQGIVPLSGANLGECLADYFVQSEQLNSLFWLAADAHQCSGFMLQELPPSREIATEQREQQWEHVSHLARTITDEELLTLDHQELLYRLYHEDKVRVFDSREVRFGCSCSETRTRELIRTIGRGEAEDIIRDEGVIQVVCEFCNHDYQFDSVAVASIFDEDDPAVH
ncbi:MAG TPA: Hsp33 family molecular chaperone HslO [Pseudomonadales bacterium]|nr:Hsp33 family molecular chaperone HslO [Pseudomonadales bacterium]